MIAPASANARAGSGITQRVGREIERALEHLEGGRESEAVHEVRKCFKKVRAGLRLLRDGLGDDVYRRENGCFRDAARRLTEVRDADILVETWDEVARKLADRIEPGAAAAVRAALVANRQEVARRVLGDERAFAAVRDVATRALARLQEWRIAGDDEAALARGLARVYRAGRRALSLAEERPSVEALHEWRKQVKYVRYQRQLLGRAWGPAVWADQLRELSRRLGEDHDLAILRRTLAADPRTYGGHATLKGVLAAVDGRREELERQAFALGRQLYEASSMVCGADAPAEEAPMPCRTSP